MSRIKYRVTVKLLSDAIFGTGYSIPGGEDIAVCRNEQGYPYLKGSTFKGILRESLENWLVWTGGTEETCAALMGEKDRGGALGDRRVRLTGFELQNPPAEPERCFGMRSFTSLKDGVAKEGSLRQAACICTGLIFCGEISCAQADRALVKNAVESIKWMGAMRSRGFGRVQLTAEEVAEKNTVWTVGETAWIHYQLRTELPVIVTDLYASHGNAYETRNYIPGTAVRGAVVSALAEKEAHWFAENKETLLYRIRFLDAMPNPEGRAVLPSIKGFYENKDETEFETVMCTGNFTPGFKRAKLGQFCTLDGHTLRYWSAKTGGTIRILRDEGGSTPFRTRYLEAGQVLDGYICLRDPQLAPMIAKAIPQTLWLGADRYEGFGKCTLTAVEAVEKPAWFSYGYGTNAQIPNELYLVALSPFTMMNAWGEPCGLDEEQLSELLGTGAIEVLHASTSVGEYSNFNRTWGCREPMLRMYEAGSIFKIRCAIPPTAEALQRVETEGLGVRRGQGFGQVLFLRKELFEGITAKMAVEEMAGGQGTAASRLRRAKYQWVQAHCNKLYHSGLSKSQVGSIQALCERAIACGGNTEELYQFLNKNCQERSAEYKARFEKVATLIQETLKMPLEQTLKVPCENRMEEKLRLLCLLFDHSRKEERA